MGTYAAAKAAIRQRLSDNWKTTRITYQNEVPDDPFPPTETDEFGFPVLQPWVHLEITSLPGGGIRGAGSPGSQVFVTHGFLYVHVFVPTNTGDATATQYAEAIGELFRNEKVYDAGDGCYLRTWAPRVDEGGLADSDSGLDYVNTGNWFRVTMSVPFEYWHRG